MKKLLLIVLILNSQFIILNSFAQCPEALRRYAQRYPAAQEQDLQKLVFQDTYGPGHLIKDSASCARYIQEEAAIMELPSTSDFPLYEYTLCDSNFVRVNLRVIKEGRISLQQLTSAVLRSAEGMPTVDPSQVKHHSRAFNEAYHPHYRIVRREIFEKEIFPLINK